jgi:UDP-N-acetylmuramoyl-L-alanyl-D-glutamate--2,6-diaminopimelate ligase
MGVRLTELATELDRMGWLTSCSGDAEVVDVHLDSRAVTAGSLFCCLEGEHHDGHDFADEAVRRGAVALLATRALERATVPVVVVDAAAARRAVAVVAASVHGHPSREIPVVGVTGTNGKTTTAAMLAAICTEAGLDPEVFGTLSGARTTAESTELQRAMRRAVDTGRRVIIMEVTSHALALDRVYGIVFRTATFTNLGHDHLDFHGTVEAYFEAKAKLFERGVASDHVINRDDEHGRTLIARLTASGQGEHVHAFGVGDAGGLVETLSSNVFSWNGLDIVVPLGGRHNVYNALAAAVTAVVLGIPRESIAQGLARVGRVPGRLERVDVDAPFDVYVDYAHTPDSLRAVLSAARSTLATGARLIVVFGCGGDRDATKRPVMGAVASELADVVVVTTDNARSEDPAAIANEVVKGAGHPDSIRVILDRREAINGAIASAQSGDVVVIAGKGHERGQTIGTVTVDFDDMDEARGALLRVMGGAN